MGYKTELQSNNADLQTILNKVNALPEAGSGGGGESGGGGIEYEIVTIPANISGGQCTVHYSLSRVTGAYGGCSEAWETYTTEGLLIGVKNNSLYFIEGLMASNKTAYMDTADEYITYSNGTMSFFFIYDNPNSIDVLLINDPSAEAISS